MIRLTFTPTGGGTPVEVTLANEAAVVQLDVHALLSVARPSDAVATATATGILRANGAEVGGLVGLSARYVPDVPPVAATLFGYNARPTPAALVATHGTPEAWRHFNTGAPDPAVWAVGLPVVDSFKLPPAQVAAGAHDATIRAYLKAKPAALRAWVCLFHEPEDNVKSGEFTAAQWRAAQDRLFDLCHEVPNCTHMPILMDWTLDPASGRNPDDFLRGYRYDVIGWDTYAKATTDDMAPKLARIIAASKAVGKPYAICETGVPSGDETKRAAWMTTWARQLREATPAPVAVTWFITKMAAPSPDYSLPSALTQAAMRGIIAA